MIGPARMTPALIAVLVAAPQAAHASSLSAPEALRFGGGLVGLAVAVVLLLQLVGLRRLVEGAAIAENILYAVLAALCLVTAVILGWVEGLVSTGFSAEHARLGADLLTVAAMFFLVVYFMRVKRAMRRFLTHLTGEAQMLTAVVDPDAGGE